MTNVFHFKSYKEFLVVVLKSDATKRGTQSAMARHLGCQASYLYQILKGKADLTEDQAYKVTTFLKFDAAERDYFMNLVRASKASTAELRRFLVAELEAKARSHQDLKNRVMAAPPRSNDDFWEFYFASQLPSLVHVLTSSKDYQTVKALALRLSISEDEALMHLKKLAEMGLVENKGKTWTYSSSSLHFDKESKFNQQMQRSRRIQSLSAIDRARDSRNIYFSSLFTLDAASLEKLRVVIAEFVQASHKVIHAGGCDDAYVLNLDLFRA